MSGFSLMLLLGEFSGLPPIPPVLFYLLQRDTLGFRDVEITPYQTDQSYRGKDPEYATHAGGANLRKILSLGYNHFFGISNGTGHFIEGPDNKGVKTPV